MSAENRSDILVVGVGNISLSDEGAASRILHRITGRVPPGVEVMDAGLAGPGLLELIEGKRKVIIVDAVDAGRPPGTVFRFKPHEVVSADDGQWYSLHKGNILLYLRLAEVLGRGPEEVVVIGVQPETVSPGDRLSTKVGKSVTKAADLVLEEIQLETPALR
ncbi:hydrogenase maturation protease [Planctomycetota bacterium]